MDDEIGKAAFGYCLDHHSELEKKGPEWEVCEVEYDGDDNEYWFTYRDNPPKLFDHAQSIRGYDGTTFKEWPEKWFSQVNMWIDEDGHYYSRLPHPLADIPVNPATPDKVRFRK